METNDSGTDCDLQVYAGDRHFGRQGGGSFFYHSDWLGTVRKIISDQFLLNGSVQTCTSLPFGDGLNCNSNASNVWHFTGKERDYESGLDNFDARYLGSSLGRFTSPDSPFTDQAQSDPQSWNPYSYVRNNPLSNMDPTGRSCISTSDQPAYHDDNQGGQTCAVADEANPNVGTVGHLPEETEDAGRYPLRSNTNQGTCLTKSALSRVICIETGGNRGKDSSFSKARNP